MVFFVGQEFNRLGCHFFRSSVPSRPFHNNSTLIPRFLLQRRPSPAVYSRQVYKTGFPPRGGPRVAIVIAWSLPAV